MTVDPKLQKLYDAWAILKKETLPAIEREKAAEIIVTLQAEIAAIDPTFKQIDLRTTQYNNFLRLPAIPMKPSILKPEEIERVKEETRHFFAIKQIVEEVAEKEYPRYNNGASVGQATSAVMDTLAAFS